MGVNPLSFGISVTPDAAAIDDITRLAQVADAAGLDLVAVQDHPYQAGFLDTWTLITHLADRTEHIRFFPAVADLALRPPVMLAKAAASLDLLSGGRIELGVGAGAFAEAIAGMGGPARTPAESVEATEEALQIIKAAWGSRPFALVGEHHQVHGYQPGPTPSRAIGLWVGAQKPRMLRMIGRLADGWVCPLNIYIPPPQVPDLQDVIDRAAVEAGRDPARIRRIYNVFGTIGPGTDGQGLNGPAELWAETLADWATRLRFDTFVFWPVVSSPEQIRMFAEEVVPRTRALLAR
ncbi:N5,N10-methylene tetrahydromethanopterin reductase [Planotetraspora thailandica]|uniref:N5,N10-methylene tetrahydromethanopterin reductase n=1 Tax=Planotetraspora thailandica TaxID=487172 RepID=A0A8J3Y0I5_9ACTN|nr:LLM class flavin-dependent oxidoreductase [Planotetraspora thailandica]GII58597.1 N5,N10-methylene tetrahydromethanopterin reductase [Planotetraspora thailandica]